MTFSPHLQQSFFHFSDLSLNLCPKCPGFVPQSSVSSGSHLEGFLISAQTISTLISQFSSILTPARNLGNSKSPWKPNFLRNTQALRLRE